MDFFYDGQVRRYVTQFMRIFIGFKYQDGDGDQKHIPVMYGDLTRQVANIIKENSENKLPNVPRVACYISNLEMDTSRLADATFVSKVNIRERNYNLDENGDPLYTGEQGAGYTVERLMPTPFNLTMKADIWTSNTDQKLQLLEQILILFNPSLEIQTTDNYLDWTSLTTVYLSSINFSSRSIPAGADSDIDICSLEFAMPIYITPPAKVKKLGIVRTIIANIFTEEGDVRDINQLVYNQEGSATTLYISSRYDVLLFKSNNGQDYDYDLTIIDQDQAVISLGLEDKDYKTGTRKLDWTAILDKLGGFHAGSLIYFKQPNGSEMVGTFAVNPIDPTVMVVTFDRDTVPENTLIASTVSGLASRGTVDAIINPYRFNPITAFGGQYLIPAGTRYLMLDSVNLGNSNEDGPDAWKNADGTDPIIKENSIIEWDGTNWVEIFDPETVTDTVYIQNLRTGIKYRWDNPQWLKAFEGEYASGFWRFAPDS